MRLLLLIAIVASLGAAPPDDAASRADGIHRRALQEGQRGRWAEAATLWEAAAALDPLPKYAFNLATTYVFLARWDAAWGTCERARALGVAESDRADLDAACGKAEAAVLKLGALVTLRVEPAEAAVRVEGAAWPGGRVLLTRAASQVVVTCDGYRTLERLLEHPLGTAPTFELRLEALPRSGAVSVTGTPVGAIVRLGGSQIGALPRAARADLPAGSYRIEVSHPGFVPTTTTVRIEAGKTAEVSVTLVAATPVVTNRATGPSGLSIGAWTTLGLGAAAAGTGIALLVRAAGLASDGDALNEAPPPDFDARFSSARDDFDGSLTAGATLVGLGAAALVGGAVLWLLDDTSTTVVAPGQGGLGAAVTF